MRLLASQQFIQAPRLWPNQHHVKQSMVENLFDIGRLCLENPASPITSKAIT